MYSECCWRKRERKKEEDRKVKRERKKTVQNNAKVERVGVKSSERGRKRSSYKEGHMRE